MFNPDKPAQTRDGRKAEVVRDDLNSMYPILAIIKEGQFDEQVITMEKDFFDLYENQTNLAVEVGHNSVADWCITVYDKRSTTLENSKQVVFIQECNRILAFSVAYTELCKYLSETRGGY